MSPSLIPMLEEAVAFHEEYQIQRPWMPKPNPITLDIAQVKELLAACRDAGRYKYLEKVAKEELLRPERANCELLPDIRTHWVLPTIMCSGPIGGFVAFGDAVDGMMERGN